jgi:hypothetical protein
MRSRLCVPAVALAALLAASMTTSARAPGEWGAVKGRVVLDGGIPDPVKVTVDADPKECLKNGALYHQDLVVDPRTRGVRWAVVWLISEATINDEIPKITKINPNAEPKEAQVVIDQPCCQFEPRVVCLRAGKQTLTVKNPAPMPHNIKIDGPKAGVELNEAIASKGELAAIGPWKATKYAVPFSCTIHKWMKGWVLPFSHPYYCVTNEKGEFEIKDAPAGKCRIVVWHETEGFVVGDKGKERIGVPIEVVADKTTDLGEYKLKLSLAK